MGEMWNEGSAEELARPVQELEEKWKLVPAFLQVTIAILLFIFILLLFIVFKLFIIVILLWLIIILAFIESRPRPCRSPRPPR